MNGNTRGNAGQTDRQLTIEDLAAAWIAVHWVESLGGFFGAEDMRPVRREANALSERFGIHPSMVTTAAEKSLCPSAALLLPAIAGQFRRFRDAFPAYSTHESWEASSRRFLPRIRQAEDALTAIHLEWLTEILREMFPDKADATVPVSEVLSLTERDSLQLDAVKCCKACAGHPKGRP